MQYEVSERHNRTLIQCIVDGKRETIVTIGPTYTKRVDGKIVTRLHTQIHNLPGVHVPELTALINSIKNETKEASDGTGKPSQ